MVKRPRWKPRWNEDAKGIAELISYLWLNGDPALTKLQAERLAPANSEKTVRQRFDQVATSIEGLDMVMLANDPFGFLEHPAIDSLTKKSSQGGETFESVDGKTHLLFADSPAPLKGYRDSDTWLKELRKSLTEWKKADGKGLAVRLTGEPVFSSEIGVAMENDLSGSISITLGLIGLLFWWMQRRFSLLLGLAGILVIIFAVALGIAGWLYGELSIMALSSIEILIGLAVDYGLVICQEAKVAGHDRKALISASGKPVLFGALTTTVVFLALNLGGLPGMAQLGSIVAIGLITAAILMLIVYLPFVVKFGVNREPARGSGKMLPRQKMSWSITGALALTAIAILLVNGMPGAEFSSKIMRPRNSEAMETFEHIQAIFPAYSGKSLGLVVEAKNDAEMQQKITEAQRRLSSAQQSNTIQQASIPYGWWPNISHQNANRSILAQLAKDRDSLLQHADAIGFSETGTALGRSVLDEITKITASNDLAFPQSAAAQEVMRLFIARKPNGSGYLLGSITPAAGIEPAGKDYESFLSIMGDGIWLSGWDLFKPAIAKLVREDMIRMLAPMFILLVGMMILIFRRVRDVGMSLFAMILSALLLLAIMSIAGLKWNFVNLMATPLLLGTGIDYAIHVTLSLRRTGGNFKELWQGTGKALLFCGASNVIGFGSLVFSSSEALVSLGTVAVIGILLSMGISIFLLPGWSERKF
ncbi:MAG: MMPL family transporter [Akkermansiaceae bacterium]|nr:MMPL family transporter [Akkermansiaceae bacterium]